MKLLSLAEASAFLTDGKLVLFPTETFYALGCDATRPEAIEQIFLVKRRSTSLPLPVVIGKEEQLSQIVADVSIAARRLMSIFWPGSLSIIFPAVAHLSAQLTGETGNVAVRISPHSGVRRLCLSSGVPLVASSANLSGQPPVAGLLQLEPSLVHAAAGIYNAGQRPQGLAPSTVVKVVGTDETGPVRIVRSGMVSSVALKQAGFQVV